MTSAEQRNRRIPELLILGAYIALVVVVALHHELWKDEVHAWTVATETPTWGALLHELHLEGHPPLWYALLRVLNSVFHTPLVLPIVSVLIGVAMVWLVVWHAPFSLVARGLFAFGVLPAYEYSVMSRSYGLGALLLLFWAFRISARPSGISGVCCLVLASLTSLHAAVAAMSLTVMYWPRPDERTASLTSVRAWTLPLLILAGSLSSFALMWPDTSNVASPALHESATLAWRNAVNAMPRLLGVIPDLPYYLSDVFGTKWFIPAMPWRADVLNSMMVVVNLLFALSALREGDRRGLFAFCTCLLVSVAFFVFAYPGVLRHEGIVLVVLVATVWATNTSRRAPAVRIGQPKQPLTLSALLGWQALLAVTPVSIDLAGARTGIPALATELERRGIDAPIVVAEAPNTSDAVPYYLPHAQNFQARTGDLRSWHRYVRMRDSLSVAQLLDSACAVSARLRVPAVLLLSDPLWADHDSADVRRGVGQLRFLWTSAQRTRVRLGTEPMGYFSAFTDERFWAYLVRGDSLHRSAGCAVQ